LVDYEVYEVEIFDVDNEDGFAPIEKQEKKKSRKIVVPSTAVPQYGGGQGVNKEESITIRRDGCFKFSQGLCIRLLGYNRDRIIPILPDSDDKENESKVWLQMDTEIEYTEDTRKRIRLEHEYDDRGIRQTTRYGEIYLRDIVEHTFSSLYNKWVVSSQDSSGNEVRQVPMDDATSIKLVKGNGLWIDDHFQHDKVNRLTKPRRNLITTISSRTRNRKYTMIELDASVIDWENPDSKIVQRNPDITKHASLEEHFVDEEIED